MAADSGELSLLSVTLVDVSNFHFSVKFSSGLRKGKEY